MTLALATREIYAISEWDYGFGTAKSTARTAQMITAPTNAESEGASAAQSPAGEGASRVGDMLNV
jgi:hypothetical protein